MAIVSKVKKKLAKNVHFIIFGWLAKLKYQDYKRLHLAQRKPELPEVINMNANDICNSKCTMCNIWKQKLDFEITPTQLEEVLRDPLFSKIKAVGITGGEPTLREDLPDLYEACCKSLPTLQGLSIITNAIKDKDVIARVTRVGEICDQYGVKFSMMVSLDGYGETHDRIRGVKGNFESAMRVINHFRKNTKIPVAIG
ncbi:MAG: radical SAM protein, partial [Marinoscillum sp.]